MSRSARIGFVPFCEALGVQLTPGQRVLCLVAFDGVEPCDLKCEERELARSIFGDVERIPTIARGLLVAMIGARSGKSWLLGGLKALHSALTVSLGSLAPGEQAFALLVAPDLRLARQSLRYATGAAKGSRKIAPLVDGETADSLTLSRPDFGGAKVSIEVLPATRGGRAVRGRSLVYALLDEACFFLDADAVINDVDLHKAIAPRLMPGAVEVIASTPWIEGTGLLHELHEANFGAPQTALAAHAPTGLMRNDAHTLSMIDRERARDPDNARREYDAIPLAAGSASFINAHAIAAMVDHSLPLGGSLCM